MSLHDIARKRVAAYVLRQDDAAIRRRAFELEDLVMAVAREYHEGECEALADMTCGYCQSVLPCCDGLTFAGHPCQHPCCKGRAHEQPKQPTPSPGPDDSKAVVAIRLGLADDQGMAVPPVAGRPGGEGVTAREYGIITATAGL